MDPQVSHHRNRRQVGDLHRGQGIELIHQLFTPDGRIEREQEVVAQIGMLDPGAALRVGSLSAKKEIRAEKRDDRAFTSDRARIWLFAQDRLARSRL